MTARYTVELRPAARRDLDKLDGSVRARTLRALSALAQNPRPAGVIKLSGAEDLWRLRVGDHRVVFAIADKVLLVTVVRIAHRREVYRDL